AEAATAVVVPLPATREEVTRDGRVGRRENAFLDTYFAFFGRFARLETESEARRTLIELALQDASPPDDPYPRPPDNASSHHGGGSSPDAPPPTHANGSSGAGPGSDGGGGGSDG
ncbi:unnamed protein product, partial [Laminaria digitata]